MEAELQQIIKILQNRDGFDWEMLFRNEGILDMETFSMLNENDFNRMNLNTGQRKQILKHQKKINEIKDYMTEESTGGDTSYEQYEYIEQDDETLETSQVATAQRSVSLEKEFDIDLIFKKTPEGRNVMASLKEKNPLNNKLVKSITKILCEYLINNYGFHPSTHYKNIIAVSLVNKYDMLKSEFAEAVWFYPHGRGYGKQTTEENLIEIVENLKFIVPSDESLEMIRANWIKTFKIRQEHRRKVTEPELMLEMFPLSTAFRGALINLDFNDMFPSANPNIEGELDSLQIKITNRFAHLHSTIPDHFIRMLLIVKEKNPSRGAKRTNDGSQKVNNLLERIVEWIDPEEDVEQYAERYKATKNPVLIVKAPIYSSGEGYVRIGKNVFYAGSELPITFFTLIKSHYYFNTKFEPSLSNFYFFFTSTVLKITKPTTTTNSFLLQLK
ncbi:uncharacterized protein LOC129723490 isoform X5 [Wyeomyia smithii]|uniref:uncharacterized protein LOC129723490 isoform X5 n=1 Tax=Wyeomyia smithii TaxID=174621 RepID=UPI002467DC1B|nr:uncharacterized protein LOC129723490 isoform X5 [Wyeomyia smithii]